jgi:serine/threonine-protein kinase HipA
MEREVFVYVDLAGAMHLVGHLWAGVHKNKEGATSEYADAWQENPNRFSLEPALKLGSGTFHTGADSPVFGAIGDSAPDRCGRALMKRMERRHAEGEGKTARALHEIDAATLAGRNTNALILECAEISGRMLDRAQSAELGF